MTRVFALIVALLFATTPAFAQLNSGSSYDWRTGSSYRWHENPDGSIRVNGFNGRTGSMWNQTIQPNGDQRGVDSHGDSWRYNNATGTYWNSNGTLCTGKGAARICN